MIDQSELGALFSGLQAAVTVADEDARIIFMNDRAIAHYGDRGGQQLIETNLLECHNPASQEQIRAMYSRYRAGDLTPTRYHEDKGEGIARTIVHMPIVIDGQLRGLAELMWSERRDLIGEL